MNYMMQNKTNHKQPLDYDNTYCTKRALNDNPIRLHKRNTTSDPRIGAEQDDGTLSGIVGSIQSDA